MALNTRKESAMSSKTASDDCREALVSLVDDLISKEPFKAEGFDWAAQPSPSTAKS